MSRSSVLHKICPRAAWEEAQAAGTYKGAPIDLQDGFMHFSTPEQAPTTLRLYFKGQKDLVTLVIRTEDLEKAARESGLQEARVQWDHSQSRGEDFPHLYGMPLPASIVSEVIPIPNERE
jgi:uncharacterized protein (DUF952 family)